jgi:hypothetical protein
VGGVEDVAIHGGRLRPDIEVARSYARIADMEVRAAVAGLLRAVAERSPCGDR